jgi:hypothetical protein
MTWEERERARRERVEDFTSRRRLVEQAVARARRRGFPLLTAAELRRQTQEEKQLELFR